MGSIKGVQTLKTRREFERVYYKAKGFHTPYFVLFFLKGPEKRFGFVASKKVGKSVKRNRAKRLLRALLLANFDDLVDGTYILVAKPKILESDFGLMQKRMHNILKSIRND